MDRIIYNNSSEEQVSVVEDNEEVIVRPQHGDDSDSDEVSSHSGLGNSRMTQNFAALDQQLAAVRVHKLEEGDKDYETVKSSFVSGLMNSNSGSSCFFKNVNVVGIHKKDYESNVMDEARLKVFKVFVAAVATNNNGGDPNLKYGWFGGSRDEIREILLHGFRRIRRDDDDDKTTTLSSYGRGVCLSPANIPIKSAKMSVPDPDGWRHVLLCRVILGKLEIVSYGSQKDQPSSMEFNSGVDNLESPTKYIIWEPYMNTQILPVYVVSFRADSITEGRSLRMSTSPNMSISGLMRHLTNYLTSSKMSMIKRFHHAYSKNKISRSAFVRTLRSIAGDDILRAIIQGL